MVSTGRHRIDGRGTLYRSRAYGRRSRIVWLAVVLPAVLLLGLIALALAVYNLTGHTEWHASQVGYAFAIGQTPLVMLAGSLPAAYRGHRPGVDASVRRH